MSSRVRVRAGHELDRIAVPLSSGMDGLPDAPRGSGLVAERGVVEGMASLRDEDPANLALTTEQVAKLRGAYGELARRSRHVLTVRLGLASEQLTLKRGAEPLGLSLDRVRQLQVLALDMLTDAVAYGDATVDRGPLRDAISETLRDLAIAGTT